MNDRYLAQFYESWRWKTDCAFQEGQLENAIFYVQAVVKTNRVLEGRVFDQLQKRVVYKFGGPDGQES